jgi:DNA-binding CsgD family transcriptional regulator
MSHQVFAPLGVRRQIIIGLPGKPLLKLALNRAGSDFSKRDRLLLSALAPYLAAAVKASAVLAEFTNRCETLEAALNASTEPLLRLDPDGALVHATDAARAVMEQCFGSNAWSANRLPEEMSRWVSKQLDRASADDLPLAEMTTRFKSRGCTLECTFIRGVGAHTLLVRRCDPEFLTDKDPARHGSPIVLTSREIEILGWVERGMGNADIAVLCGISVRTVQKHLEHVFRKLNVENRAAAVRKLRDFVAAAPLKGR